MDGKTLHEQLGKGVFPSEDKLGMARPEHRVARLFQESAQTLVSDAPSEQRPATKEKCFGETVCSFHIF